MKEQISAVLFERAQRGWVCTVVFSVKTQRQCTTEVHEARAGCRFLPVPGLAIAGAFIAALRERRRISEALKAIPGEHSLAF